MSDADSHVDETQGSPDSDAAAPGEGGDTDRRDAPRAPIELKVEYKKLNSFFADYTKNISKGGTFIRTRKPLDVGTEFVFKLVVPKLPEALALRGQVKWVVREGEPPPPGVEPDHEPGMGIRFLYASGEQRASIEATVEKLMIDSLGQLLYSKLIGRERGGTDPGQGQNTNPNTNPDKDK